ncbi:MAG: ParB-like nuclease domain-containing protein [Erysipelotrichaceae bacterium]|nr:ParB-like nuclease domain-containing protein [Erysipelotrichaceae bacterium]
MRIVKVKIDLIEYQPSKYPPILKNSIQKIGLSFPIKVITKQNKYECIDGHKRLTILKELNIQDVNCIIMDNGNNRSNDCWRQRNYH